MSHWPLTLAAELWTRPAHEHKPFDAELAHDIAWLVKAAYLVGFDAGRQAKTRAAILTLKEL